MAVAAWNPWRDLRTRRHILLRMDAIAKLAGGGFYARRGDRVLIALDPDLTQVERNAVLAHELVHDERGGVCDDADAPETWAAVVGREEERVNRIVAERLVPVGRLLEMAEAIEDLGGCLTVADVAEEFSVPEDVAERAMRLVV